MAAALVHFLARLVGSQRSPLGHNVEVRGDLQQLIQNKGPGFSDRLLHRQHADKVIAHAEMIALGFNVGIDNLIVKKLRRLRPSGDTPLVVVEQPAKESEMALLAEHFNLHEIDKLAGESLHLLVQPRKFALDLCAQQYLHAVVGELRSEFANRSGRIAEELRECRADATL